MTGPVLEANAVGRAIADAICAANPGAEVLDRDAYLRIRCAGVCRVTRAQIEVQLGHAFVLPRDLELVMSSFAGTLAITADEVTWS